MAANTHRESRRGEIFPTRMERMQVSTAGALSFLSAGFAIVCVQQPPYSRYRLRPLRLCGHPRDRYHYDIENRWIGRDVDLDADGIIDTRTRYLGQAPPRGGGADDLGQIL